MPLPVEGRQGCNPIRRICGIGCYGHWIAEKRPTAIARRLEVSRVWVYQVRRPGAEDGPTHQFSDRRPSPFAGGGDGARAARLDRTRAGSELGRVVRTFGRAGRIDQDRRFVASVEQMESYLQKKRCTPASKNARTCSRRDRAWQRSATDDGSRKARVYR